MAESPPNTIPISGQFHLDMMTSREVAYG